MYLLDIKEGDEPAQMVAGSSILLRRLLDDCANWQTAYAFNTNGDRLS